MTASQIDLVVYGIPKNINAGQLLRHVRKGGINILNCVKLTTFEGAKSFAFKVTIDGCDFEKSKYANVWPKGQVCDCLSILTEKRLHLV